MIPNAFEKVKESLELMKYFKGLVCTKHSWPFLFVDDFHNRESKSP